MGFEEELVKRARWIAEVKRRRFIKKYGQVGEMKPFIRSVFGKNFGDVAKNAIENANERINCGGYALEVDQFVLPNEDNLDGFVSSLLDRYSFVRLLGDTPLQDDEYLVFYKYMESEGEGDVIKGHHFIKVNDDGMVVEKQGNFPPNIFEGWNEIYKNSPEVAFAVKKDHDHEIDYEQIEGYNYLRMKKGLDFDETILEAIIEKTNEFNYHCHSYRLKISSDEEIFVTDQNGEVIAKVSLEGDDMTVEVKEEKKAFVDNYSGPIKPIIENGRLVNFEMFKQIRKQEDREK